MPQTAFESIGKKRSSVQHIVNLLMSPPPLPTQQASPIVRALNDLRAEPFCRWMFEYFKGSKSGNSEAILHSDIVPKHSPADSGMHSSTLALLLFHISLNAAARSLRMLLLQSVPLSRSWQLAFSDAVK